MIRNEEKKKYFVMENEMLNKSLLDHIHFRYLQEINSIQKF